LCPAENSKSLKEGFQVAKNASFAGFTLQLNAPGLPFDRPPCLSGKFPTPKQSDAACQVDRGWIRNSRICFGVKPGGAPANDQ